MIGLFRFCNRKLGTSYSKDAYPRFSSKRDTSCSMRSGKLSTPRNNACLMINVSTSVNRTFAHLMDRWTILCSGEPHFTEGG